jgi:GT2 family glycosyltransferase
MRTQAPEVSVVITTYERPRQLARVLAALARQSYPKDRFEVIVVNDGGSRCLDETLRPFGELQLQVIHQGNSGPAAGRNTGVAHSRGAVVVFTDDDCEPDASWLSVLKNAFDEDPAALLGGRTVPGVPAELCSAASQLVQDVVYDFYNTDPADSNFFASNNMALSVAGFRSIGGFDTRFRIASEDRDFCERWRCAGRRMRFVPGAMVRHNPGLTLGGFIGQHFRYGRGAAQFHRGRRTHASGRLWYAIDLHRAWRNWLFRPWREHPGSRAVALMSLLLVWQAANLAGFVYGWLVESRPSDGLSVKLFRGWPIR